MKKLVTTLLMSSIAFGGMTLANADSGYSERGEHNQKYCDKRNKGKGFAARIERMTKKLGLNEEQVKKMHEVEAKFHPQMQSLREKMKATRSELREVMHAENVDQTTVKSLAKQQGDLKAEKIVLRSQMRAEINKLLTTEQRTKMKELREKHRAKHDDRN